MQKLKPKSIIFPYLDKGCCSIWFSTLLTSRLGLSLISYHIWPRFSLNDTICLKNIKSLFIICYCVSAVAHLHKSSHLAPVAAPQMGRGSESPPELPHNHTDSEQESTSWNLHASTQTQKTHIYEYINETLIFFMFPLGVCMDSSTTLLTGARSIRH